MMIALYISMALLGTMICVGIVANFMFKTQEEHFWKKILITFAIGAVISIIHYFPLTMLVKDFGWSEYFGLIPLINLGFSGLMAFIAGNRYNRSTLVVILMIGLGSILPILAASITLVVVVVSDIKKENK